MKKSTKTTETKKELFNVADLEFNKLDEIIASKLEEKNVTRYPVAPGVTLAIFNSDRDDYDFGSLNVYGLSVDITIRSGKKGMFISYPSYKNKDGEYKNLVSNFSKSFNEILASVVNKHYE